MGSIEHGAAAESAPQRIRLDISYDGTDFRGWARQPGLRTVQGVLEHALAVVLSRHGPAPRLTVAGRTDAGVHALGQVAHLDLTAEQLAHAMGRRDEPSAADLAAADLAPFARRLNGIIGADPDVVVTRARIAPAGFDARFSAVWRRYEYRIADATVPRNPLQRATTLWYPASLDEAAMNAAAAPLLGLHDWAAYCKPRPSGTTIRSLQHFSWHRGDDGVLVARVEADAFCHSMVRSLVGATVAVGEGKLPAERLTGIRDERLRTSEFKVAPAKGLALVEVGYPHDVQLARRAVQTRAWRESGQ